MMLPYVKIYPKGRCPYCERLIKPESEECVHCGRTFSEQQKTEIAAHAKAQRKKGLRLGFIVFGAVLFALIVHDVLLL